jgi:hypothetical protein
MSARVSRRKVAPKGTPKAVTPALPPIPDAVHSVLGPIPVRLVTGSPDPTSPDCLGMWEPARRTITLRQDVAPEVLLVTLWHERVHAMLDDAGVRLTHDQAESVADAIGTQLAAELLARSRAA